MLNLYVLAQKEIESKSSFIPSNRFSVVFAGIDCVFFFYYINLVSSNAIVVQPILSLFLAPTHLITI